MWTYELELVSEEVIRIQQTVIDYLNSVNDNGHYIGEHEVEQCVRRYTSGLTNVSEAQQAVGLSNNRTMYNIIPVGQFRATIELYPSHIAEIIRTSV
jgi:hypothetical protein